MASIRDLMERFRPAGAPGPAAVAVPADRQTEIVAELEPVFARLTGAQAEARQILADAELDVRRAAESARLRAAATVATARRDADAERSGAAAAARQEAGAAQADLMAQARRSAEVIARTADERIPELVARAVELVRSSAVAR